eukprot:Nitzschia sp. Nitz4//scaffold266_size26515//20124//20510//NITZ4_008260-RA/size26515-processed-gene-0.12-mRNA-1//-1//CDS//3329544877//8213//frame0
MTIEGFLVRELDITFLDARSITNEAKVALGIEGYPSSDQYQPLQEEALRLFQGRPENEKLAMRKRNWNMEAVKISSGSLSLSHTRDAGNSEDSEASDDFSMASSNRLGRSEHKSMGRRVRGLLSVSRH